MHLLSSSYKLLLSETLVNNVRSLIEELCCDDTLKVESRKEEFFKEREAQFQDVILPSKIDFKPSLIYTVF